MRSTKELLPEITAHGRFQPPLHENHKDYLLTAFDRAEHVTLLITNPFNDESFDAAASWRNDPANNPFSFDERAFMFEAFFTAIGIAHDRYTIQPFNIKDPLSFKDLDPSIPNLVNVYSQWSKKKVALFSEHGLEVDELSMPKRVPASGTLIREILRGNHGSKVQLQKRLLAVGFVAEAIPGLMAVLDRRSGLQGV